MRSSQENPVKSHSCVVQGCAGEESRGAVAVLGPPAPHGPTVLLRSFLELRVTNTPCSLSTAWEILMLEPSLNLTPTLRLLVHSGVSSSRSRANFSFSLPPPHIGESSPVSCLGESPVPGSAPAEQPVEGRAPYSAHASALRAAGRLRPGGLESRRPGWCAAGTAHTGSCTGAGFSAPQGPASAGHPCNQPQWGPRWDGEVTWGPGAQAPGCCSDRCSSSLVPSGSRRTFQSREAQDRGGACDSSCPLPRLQP